MLVQRFNNETKTGVKERVQLNFDACLWCARVGECLTCSMSDCFFISDFRV